MRQAHPDPLPLHARLAEFEILDIIAEGEFGILYRARDHLLDREITLREYLPAGFAQRDADGGVAAASARDEELFDIGLRGFIDEARLLARLEHPALMKVYRYWEANGTAYMAMPLHAGVTLERAMREGGNGSDEASIALLLAEPLDALGMLHHEGRVHGGIAPDAILLRPDGRGLLLDIGAARKTLADLALTPTAMLKPGYAALEQYEVIPGLKPGPWTDVYAVAAIAYRLVAGMPPPDAEVRSEHDAMLPARELGSGRYRDAFLGAIDDALALMPQERTASAPALRDALGIAQAGPIGRVHAPRMPAAREDLPTMPIAPAAVERETLTTHARPAPGATAATAATAAAAATTPFVAPLTARREDAPGAGTGTLARGRAPARRRRVPEAVFVVFIAAALYAGFRSFAPHEAGEARPPVVAANVPPAAATAPTAPTAPTTPVAPAIPATPMPATSAAAGQAASPSAAGAGAQVSAANNSNPGNAAPVVSAPPAAAASAPAAPTAAPGNSAQANVQPPAAVPQPAQTQAAPAASLVPAPQPRSAVAASAAEATQRAALRREETDWLSAQSIDTLDAYESFLATYPDSSHAPAARVLVARLRWEQRQAETAHARAAAPASPARAEVREAAPRPAPVRAAQAPLIQDRIALARPPEAATVPVAPAQQPAETARIEGGTIRLHGQTMNGDFRPDPVTGAVSGHGRIAWDNGDRFEGSLVRGVKEGRGEFVWANGQRYRGDWAGGLPNGRGSIQFPNGNRYEGDMRNGAPNGVGTIVFANGNRYTGEVRDGLPNGRGTNRFANGDTYSGAWRMGKSDGHGRYTWANGDVWEGEFRDGAKTANGRMVVAARGRDAAGSVSGASSNASSSASAASAADADDPFLK